MKNETVNDKVQHDHKKHGHEVQQAVGREIEQEKADQAKEQSRQVRQGDANYERIIESDQAKRDARQAEAQRLAEKQRQQRQQREQARQQGRDMVR